MTPVNPERGDFYLMLGDPESGPTITAGEGVPTHEAPKASVYLRKDGASGTCMYVNEDGAATWVAK